MTRPPLRLGIVGCGFVTRSRHLPAIARIGEIEVVALGDVDPRALAATADAWRVARRHADAHALIADPGVEAVAVCTPAADHLPIALAALDAGRPLFVEKPLTPGLDEADVLVGRARASDTPLLVGFNLRWHRLVRAARERLRGGAIGRVRAVRSVFADPLLTRPGVPAWRRQRTAGGGSIVDKAIHHFDLWRHLLADEIDWVDAASISGAGDDEVAAVVAATTGGVALSAAAMDVTTIGNEMTIYGERGALHLDLYRFDGLEQHGLEELPGSPARRARRLLGSLAALLRNLGEARRGGVFDTSYDHQWRHFARVARGETASGCDAAEGRAALAVAEAVTRSVATGARVAVRRPGRSAAFGDRSP